MSLMPRALLRHSVSGLILLSVSSQHSLAAWPTDPQLNLPVCTVPSDQSYPTLVADGLGGTIIVWQDARAGYPDIYAQRVSSSGMLDTSWPSNGRQLSVASTTKQYPTIVSDGGHGAIVTWQEYDDVTGWDIYAQHVLPNGELDPSWPSTGRALCTAALDQTGPTHVYDGAGGVIVVWTDFRGGNGYGDVYAQRVEAGGAIAQTWPPDGLVVSVAPGDQNGPRIASDGSGGAIVAWTDSRSGAADIYAQHVLAHGNVDPTWSVDGNPVSAAPREQWIDGICSDNAGGAVVLWTDYRNLNTDIYAHRVLSTGSPDPGWPTNGRAICTAPGNQTLPTLVADAAGNVIIAWQDRRGANSDIYAQRILLSGTIAPGWFTNGLGICTVTRDQQYPTITNDGANGALVAWTDFRSGFYEDIYATHVLSGGSLDAAWASGGASLSTAANYQTSPKFIGDGLGGGIVVWDDYRNTNHDVYAQQVGGSGVLGSWTGWTIHASAGPNGSIAPSGDAIVPDGATPSYSVTASAGWHVADVLVNGLSVGSVTNYVFSPVHADQTIVASFASSCSAAQPPSRIAVRNAGTGSTLTVMWAASVSPDVVGYAVYRDAVQIASVNALTYTDSGLLRGQPYTYTVAAINACGIGSGSASASRTPDYYPVLLVHGIYSAHGAFTDCNGVFPCPDAGTVKLGDYLYSHGFTSLAYVDYPLTVGLAVAAQYVKTAVDGLLLTSGADKVQIVAHSQGGLIARYLVETMGYADRIDRLVMLGTPNHGSDLATYKLLIDAGSIATDIGLVASGLPPFATTMVDDAFGDLGRDQVRDLMPGSAFLNQLNYGSSSATYDRPAACPTRDPEQVGVATEYWLVHGTAGWCVAVTDGPWRFIGNLLTSPFTDGRLCWPNDGVVETGTSRDGDLIALGNQFKRIDVNLPGNAAGTRASHFPGSAGSCYASLLQHGPTKAFILSLLEGGPSAQNAFRPSNAHKSVSLLSVAQADSAVESGLSEVWRSGGTLGAVGSRLDTLRIDGAREAWFLQSGTVGSLSFSVTSPSGIVLTPADSSRTDVDFFSDADLALKGLIIQTPEPGPWIATTSGPPQRYMVQALVETDTILVVNAMPPNASGHGDARLVCSLASGGNVLLSGRFEGTQVSADSSTSVLAFFDDGTHGDGAAGDGVHAAPVSLAGGGTKSFWISSHLADSNPRVTRTGFAVLTTEDLSDLAPDPMSLVISRPDPSGDSLEVQVAISNLGGSDASGAIIGFGEVGHVALSTTGHDIPARSAVVARARWLPSSLDSTTLLIWIDRLSTVVQSRYDNDTMAVLVQPSTVSSHDEPIAPFATSIRSWPNPMRGGATIEFAIVQPMVVSLKLFDVVGRQVRTLHDGPARLGLHHLYWDGRTNGGQLAKPGVYFCELRAGGQRAARRVVVIH